MLEQADIYHTHKSYSQSCQRTACHCMPHSAEKQFLVKTTKNLVKMVSTELKSKLKKKQS